MKPIPNHSADYLSESNYVDYNDDGIRQLADGLFRECKDEISVAEKAYLFVRDEIAHSWDIQSSRITVTASQVLKYRQGICWAKSNLLAALLRGEGIPAGFGYQRLTIGDTPESGYCIHALNAVYLSSLNKWIRLDARGNKPGINAQFSTGEERLAFPVRPRYGEIDYPHIFAEPLKCTMETLEKSTDCLRMYRQDMPTEIPADEINPACPFI